MTKKRPLPQDMDDLSVADGKAIWKSISKNLPKIARDVKLQALVCSRHGKEPTFENLQWAQREMDQFED